MALVKDEFQKICATLWRGGGTDLKELQRSRFGPLLQIQLCKICATLWCKNDFEVKTVHKQPVDSFGSLLVAHAALGMAGAKVLRPCIGRGMRRGSSRVDMRRQT